MEKLAILDCGGQYTKVIDRRVRELGVRSEIFPINVRAEELTDYKAVILSGGPNNIGESQRLNFDEKIFDSGKPILGICYGMQLMSDHFGGVVDSNVVKEYGQTEIKIDTNSPLFEGLEETQQVLMSHGDTVKVTPNGFTIIAKTGDEIAGVGNVEKKLYGVQFHPEVDLTENGMVMFENFLRNYSEPDSLGRRIPIPWTEDELEEFRKDKNYFVTVMGNVYKNDKDYAFKRMQRRTKKLRDKYKYTGQKIEAELLTEIENLIKGNGKVDTRMTFSPDIVELLEHHFENGDIYNMSIQELKAMQTEATELRQEYSLLELACKTLGNAAYGASASPFFYFFNASLAADITGECRNLTKTMWGKLDEFFHETIWERKDLWEKFNFALDESKHDWYRTQPASIYSDTDSVYTTYGTFFDCWTEETKKTIVTDRQKTEWILKFNVEFLDKQNFEWCCEMYNPRHGQNIHLFELETISKAGIYLKKKKYLKGLVFNKGKFLDKPKVSGTGIELIKSTTPKLCRTILKDLMESLMFEYEVKNKSIYLMQFNAKLTDYRKQFYNAPVEDISQSVGVGAYKKYVIDDENELVLGKQCPVSVQAIARFNYLAHKNGEDNKKTYSGKIKYYNITIGMNSKNTGYFGFPAGELPEWAPKMDKQTQWQKNVIDPINRFLEVMDIPLANAGNVFQYTFDFG